MAGRELEAVARAVARYQAGENVSAAARAEGVSRSTLHRALARRSIEPRGPLAGENHPGWSHGKRSTA